MPIVLLTLAACAAAPRAQVTPTPPACGSAMAAVNSQARCLAAAARSGVPGFDRVRDSVLNDALRLRDSLRAQASLDSRDKAALVAQSLARVDELERRQMLSDTARFNRIVDHVAVTSEWVRGLSPGPNGRYHPRRTPNLTWVLYPNQGLFFQPVNSVQEYFHLLPRDDIPLDSLRRFGEAMYRYAVWHRGASSFPVWEYLFAWTSGGLTQMPPWRSAASQGAALVLFAELHRRTQAPVWRDRAYEVWQSFRTTWDNGGVLLSDTANGYWWEMFHPTVRVWNGAAQAVLQVGFFAEVMKDREARDLHARSIATLKTYTKDYDTGTWTLYSRTQGRNSVLYHDASVAIVDALHRQTGDLFFGELGSRWRRYQPPDS